MSVKITALHGASAKGKLNEEWMVVVNEGDKPFNTAGCSITVGKGSARPRVFHTFKAGLIVQANETCRLVTGSSGKKSHGAAPEEEGVRNAYLFLKAAYLDRAGLNVRLTNRQQEICRAAYDPAADSGLAE